jgi:hypothetical protein
MVTVNMCLDKMQTLCFPSFSYTFPIIAILCASLVAKSIIASALEFTPYIFTYVTIRTFRCPSHQSICSTLVCLSLTARRHQETARLLFWFSVSLKRIFPAQDLVLTSSAWLDHPLLARYRHS